MDREAWHAAVHGVTKSQTRLSNLTELSGEEPTCNAGDSGDAGSIPGSRRSPEGEHGNPLKYSCPFSSTMDRGAWRAIVHRVTQCQTQLKQLTTHSCRFW